MQVKICHWNQPYMNKNINIKEKKKGIKMDLPSVWRQQRNTNKTDFENWCLTWISMLKQTRPNFTCFPPFRQNRGLGRGGFGCCFVDFYFNGRKSYNCLCYLRNPIKDGYGSILERKNKRIREEWSK